MSDAIEILVTNAIHTKFIKYPEGDGGPNLDYEWIAPDQSVHIATRAPRCAQSVLTVSALQLCTVSNSRNGAMERTLLLPVCAVLVGFGIFTIAVSSGFFMQLLGAIVMALGGSAAYLMQSHRSPEAPRK